MHIVCTACNGWCWSYIGGFYLALLLGGSCKDAGKIMHIVYMRLSEDILGHRSFTAFNNSNKFKHLAMQADLKMCSCIPAIYQHLQPCALWWILQVFVYLQSKYNMHAQSVYWIDLTINTIKPAWEPCSCTYIGICKTCREWACCYYYA